MGFLGLGKSGKDKGTHPHREAPAAVPSRSGHSSQLKGGGETTTDHRARGSRRVVAVKPTGSHTRRQANPDVRKAAATAAAGTDELDLAAIAAPAAAGGTAARGKLASATAAARPTGPCRSGDAALSAFLTDKAALISAEQAAAMGAKAQQEGLSLDAAGVAMQLFSEEQLVSALTQECWVPHLKVDKYEIRKKALETIAREDAEHYGVFPVDKLGSLLTMAMVNPLDADAIRALESRTGLDIKKVVATRTEISQAIDRYYGGKVVARDATMAFTQDVEPRSVTQMMANVGSTTSAPLPTTSRPEGDVANEIQDIDDLLSADEAISPAIIDAVPLVVPAADVMEIDGSPSSPALEALGQRAIEDTDALPHAKGGKAPALEFDLDYESGSRPVEPAIAPPTSRLQASHRPQPPAAPAVPTTRTNARSGAAAAGIVLVPVMEDEFKHAITHGKAHVFEKWVGLQTRNRIINASLVESELEPLLPSA